LARLIEELVWRDPIDHRQQVAARPRELVEALLGLGSQRGRWDEPERGRTQ
jgi:hypothetical protein